MRWLQPMADKIRSNGAGNVIWAPGLSYQSQYAGFATNPVRGSDVGYAVHFYPAYGGVGDDHGKIAQYWAAQVKPCADKYPINITEMHWARFYPGDNEYWHLFDGVTGNESSGFGTGMKQTVDGQGNVSWVIHLPASLLGQGPQAPDADPDGVLNEIHNPERDNDARPAFEWFFGYRGMGPR